MHEAGGGWIDPAVDFYALGGGQQLAKFSGLIQHRFDEALAPESGVDRHDQGKVRRGEQFEVFFQQICGRVDHESGGTAQVMQLPNPGLYYGKFVALGQHFDVK